VVDDACPKAGVIAEFHLRWNQPGFGPSSPAGRGEDCFLARTSVPLSDLIYISSRRIDHSHVLCNPFATPWIGVSAPILDIQACHRQEDSFARGFAIQGRADSISHMSNPNLPVLRGERVTLRRAREEDVEARLKLGTDAEIFRMYGGNRSDARPMNREAAKRWVQWLLDHDHAWVIETDALIGRIRLDRVDLRDRRASLAIGIEDPARLGIGLGREAMSSSWSTRSTSSSCIAFR